jgi:hypothetical protein
VTTATLGSRQDISRQKSTGGCSSTPCPQSFTGFTVTEHLLSVWKLATASAFETKGFEKEIPIKKFHFKKTKISINKNIMKPAQKHADHHNN